MITATNLSEEHVLSLIDTASHDAVLLWFDMAIEHGRNNGASDHDVDVFLQYRNDPNPECRREFIKAFVKRAFREGWANRFDLWGG